MRWCVEDGPFMWGSSTPLLLVAKKHNCNEMNTIELGKSFYVELSLRNK